MADDIAKTPPQADDPMVAVVGLGGAGLKIITRLRSLKEAKWVKTLAVDTDKRSLARCQADHKIAAGLQWTNGLGCGGDIHKGERTLALVRNEIADFVADASLVLAVGGLGGGTAGGGASIVAGAARGKEVPTIFIMSSPFSFEGHGKRKTAENAARELILSANVLLRVPNDLLYSSLPADTPVDEAFAKADLEMARSILGVAEMMRCHNLIAPEMADFQSVLNERKSACAIGVGTASADDGQVRGHVALEKALESPLLGGMIQLDEADALFVTLIGGPDLNLGEVKKTLEAVARLVKPTTKIIVGANTNPAYENFIRLTLVTIQFDEESKPPPPPEPVPVPSREPVRSDSTPVQAELPLLNISRGLFENSPPFIHNGVDLDIPTFQRQSIVIDKGETQ